MTISMNTFDRHCAVLVQRTWPRKRTAVSPLDKEDYALTAITCLSITMKLYEYRRILVPGAQSTMETILKLCQSSFSMQQVEKKEFDVLNSVHWRVHPPTPQLFLHYMLIDSGFHESQESHELHDLALYIIEMSVLDYSFVTYKASEIALAALLNAMNTIMTSSTHSTDLSFLDNLLVYRTDRTRDCQKQLAAVYDDSTDAGADSSHYETTTRVQSPVSVTTDLQGSDRNNPKRGIQSPKGNISFDE